MTLPAALRSAPLGTPLLTADEFESLAYAVFVMCIGLALVAYGYHRHRERRLMADTARSEIEAAAVGAVELRGVVEPAQETVPAPLTDEDCAVVDYEVEEYKRHDDVTKEWVTVDAGIAAEPFYLDDGTGRVLVDPSEWSSDYDISEANRTRETDDGPGVQPDAVAGFLEAYADVPPGSSYDRRYTQEVIPVGARAFVFGDAESAADVDLAVAPESDLVVTEDDDTEMFLISDKPEDELVSGRRFSLPAWGAAGIGAFSLGLWWFLSVLGV